MNPIKNQAWTKLTCNLNIISVDSDYNSLSIEAKSEAWKNPENPSLGTKLTCVFGPEKKLPEPIPEEPVSQNFHHNLFEMRQSVFNSEIFRMWVQLSDKCRLNAAQIRSLSHKIAI